MLFERYEPPKIYWPEALLYSGVGIVLIAIAALAWYLYHEWFFSLFSLLSSS